MNVPRTASEAAFLAAIVDTSDDAIVTKDLNGIVTSWNRAAERIFGYSAEEMVGESILRMLPTGREGEEAEILSRLRRGERIDHFETVRRRKDGSLVDVSITISPIRDDSGTVVGASKVARDISDRRKSAIQSVLLASIVESSDDAIVSKDLNGVVTSWNLGAERIFGYLAEEMIGQAILKIIPPDRLDEEPRILERIGKGERVDHFETVRMRKDGGLIQVSVTISPICDATGKVIGASKVARDVTEQKRLQAELHRQAEELRQYADSLAYQHRQKDQFMAMLAHELRNPLAPMRTALEILRLRANCPDQVNRVRQTLDRQTKNLTRLVDDLLDVSRLTQGKMPHRFERIDLASLARATCAAYLTEAEAAGLSLTFDVPQIPVWVMGDATRLDQVLDNLIENAIKFTERGGQVKLTLTTESDSATLLVSDTGVGMDAGLLPRLFDPFTQSDQSLARTRGGLGLGLAIVKGLAELHGGSIEAYSAGLGKGSEFRLKVPAVTELPALTSAGPSVSKEPNGKRVLVVEDNRDAADSLAELLELFGYHVSVAYTGPDGVAAATEFKPDVILCDIGLPGLDGYEVAEHIRHDPLTASIRLIAVTGYGSEADRKRAQQAGFDTHLVKPVDPDRLLGELS